MAIIALRREQGLSRRELADKTMMNYGTLSRLETGRGGPPKRERLETIASALQIDVEQIDQLAETITKEDLEKRVQAKPQELEALPKPRVKDFDTRLETVLKSPLVPQLISRLRHLYGLERAQLSERSEIPEPRLKKFEDGSESPRVDERQRLGRVFGLHTELFNSKNPYRIAGPDFYYKIRACSIKQNITPNQVATRALSSVQTLEAMNRPDFAPTKDLVERYASVLKVTPAALGDPTVSVQQITYRLPKSLPEISPETLRAWNAKLDDFPTTSQETEAVEEEVPKSAPKTPTTKMLLEAQIISQAQTLFSYESFETKDFEDLLETLDCVFRIAKLR